MSRFTLYDFEVARCREHGRERARRAMREGSPEYEEREISRAQRRLSEWADALEMARKQHKRLPARPEVEW